LIVDSESLEIQYRVATQQVSFGEELVDPHSPQLSSFECSFVLPEDSKTHASDDHNLDADRLRTPIFKKILIFFSITIC
jgi:hypothetical protein